MKEDLQLSISTGEVEIVDMPTSSKALNRAMLQSFDIHMTSFRDVQSAIIEAVCDGNIFRAFILANLWHDDALQTTRRLESRIEDPIEQLRVILGSLVRKTSDAILNRPQIIAPRKPNPYALEIETLFRSLLKFIGNAQSMNLETTSSDGSIPAILLEDMR